MWHAQRATAKRELPRKSTKRNDFANTQHGPVDEKLLSQLKIETFVREVQNMITSTSKRCAAQIKHDFVMQILQKYGKQTMK